MPAAEVCLTPSEHQTALRYVERFFVSKNRLCEMSGVTEPELDRLVADKAVPGVIYAWNADGHWWSALGRFLGHYEGTPPDAWSSVYTPAAAAWIRPHAIGQDTPYGVEAFEVEFNALLDRVSGASAAYPECFVQDLAKARVARTETARREWRAWMEGAYGVCLRTFSAETCIRKEALSVEGRLMLESGTVDRGRLLSIISELELYLLPFAPWERAGGTPGKVIDQGLSLLQGGVIRPYD